MSKLLALFGLFRKGSAVSDPELWRDRQAAINGASGLLAAALAVASAFGHNIEVSQDDMQAIAAGFVAVVGLVNGLLHVATSKNAGLPAKSQPDAAAELPEAAQVQDSSVRNGRAPYL